MKTLYFDCSSGISGNMTLGALLEIIEDDNYLLNELKKLNVDGYKIEISKKVKNGITGKYVDVILDDDSHAYTHNHEHEHSHSHEHEHDHQHEHHHHEHRNLNDINEIIDNSSLDDETKELAKRIFLRVAKAEAKVHDKSLEEVHFHEVGAIDSIVDIVGTAILINKIKPDKILSSVVNDEYGCGVIGKVVNVTADESVMDGENVNIELVNAISFDPYTHGYYKVTERVGNAFKGGLQLKK